MNAIERPLLCLYVTRYCLKLVIKQVVRESDVLLVLVFMLMLYKIRKHITAS